MKAEKKGYTAIVDLLTYFPLMHRAIALGAKSWNRSKVMLVGEGRVGKTALCNSMLGKAFVETESTIGLAQLTCYVRSASARDGRWAEHKKPAWEYEAGVAQIIRNMESLQSRVGRISEDGSVSPGNGSVSANIYLFRSEPLYEKHNLVSESIRLGGDRVDHTVAPIHPDIGLVKSCLTDPAITESNLILSLFDFGGESVCSIIHHLFLTPHGVYIVVFNMLDMLDENKRDESLSEMSFWINSIVMHTRDPKNGKIAPMFLVGTHKDAVSSISNHKRISEFIEERFRRNAAWPYIQENENFCFFPVKSIAGQSDDDMMNMMTAIESVVRKADHVKEPRPLAWLRALDELEATKKSFLTLNEASSIAIANGVEKDTVSLFLSFLNDLGIVLWLDETGLRDVVILEIITFFVEPATQIICDHRSKHSDSTIGHAIMQEGDMGWDEMMQRGVISRQLMEFLLAYKMDTTNILAVINIMLKYGLMVKLEQGQDQLIQQVL